MGRDLRTGHRRSAVAHPNDRLKCRRPREISVAADRISRVLTWERGMEEWPRARLTGTSKSAEGPTWENCAARPALK
jgi:hypothetical protein